jgi:hypothetical protein
LVFVLSHCGPTLPDRFEGVNREVAGFLAGDVQVRVGSIVNCSLSFWKRLRPASATFHSTSTWCCREKMHMSVASARPV